MKFTYHICLLVWIITAMLSCGNPQPYATKLLAQAEQLIDEHPDSALLLIDSIFYPEKSLSKEEYMRYSVARVRTRYKNYLPIYEDTLIFTAKEYFISRPGNHEQKALASFYSGCVYLEKGDYEQTMQYYKEAEEFAASTSNMALKGLIQYNIGDLLSTQGMYSDALANYRLAEQFYAQAPDNYREQQAYSLGAIGRVLLLSGQQDRAFTSLHKGLDLAKAINDKKLQSILTQNLSIVYMQEKKYNEAVRHLRESFTLNIDSNSVARYYLNFAELYTETEQTDSAAYYSNKLEQMADSVKLLNLKSSIFHFLATQHEAKGNYEKALDFQKRYTGVIAETGDRRMEQSVYDVQQKYDFMAQQSRYDHQLLQRQRLSIILLTFFLMASLFSVILLRRVIQQKNKLLSLQNTIETLNKTAVDLQKQKTIPMGHEAQLRETLLWRFDVLHKSSLLKSELSHIEKMDTKKAIARFEQIVYGKESGSQWDTLVNAIDELNPGLSHFIQNNYPQLSETEFKVLLLSYAGLPSKEIALLINQSVHTVNMGRTHIRRKIGLKETGADFCAQLRDNYEENRRRTEILNP
ncbi:tetratricopeptide repeat protein [Proteiniphilum sp.]|nr:LuxR C-terminal-related transcriptional regulator [Proteiniphilum sp.]MEA4916260.1 LuxR C-terminal-related transcriptional regulator [Proteiniphilum sp.]